MVPKPALAMKVPAAPNALIAVKAAHTLVWWFFVGCILGIPVAAARNDFRAAVFLIALVMLECAVLALNRGRCPLTDLACRFTADRTPNFDIYLPVWVARYNKQIFGPLFVAVSAFALLRWWLTH